MDEKMMSLLGEYRDTTADNLINYAFDEPHVAIPKVLWDYVLAQLDNRLDITPEYKKVLRPVAEVLAMVDGNAFFGMEKSGNGDDIWYEQYLPGAKKLFEDNGGMNGWAGKASFARGPDNV